MKLFQGLALILLLAFFSSSVHATPSYPKTSPSILWADLYKHIGFLASEKLQGRMTGSEGERLATDYVAGLLEQWGFEGAGPKGSFFDEFEFTAGVSLGQNNGLSLEPAKGRVKNLRPQVDYRPLTFSQTGSIPPSSVVFAGYGIQASKSEEFGAYDSYTHLDVQDKWVLMLRFMPENISAKQRQHLSRFSSIRFKAMVARQLGARGILIASGPTSKVKNQLIPLSFDASSAESSLAALSITDALAQKILNPAHKNLRTLQKQLDSGKPRMGFEIQNLKLSAQIDIQKVRKKGRNVLALLPGGRWGRMKKSTLALGAHIDHLGKGIESQSLARETNPSTFFPGADDNASGVAAVLEIAEWIAHLRATKKLEMKHNLLLGFWSGEEIGLLGSHHFVKNRKPKPKIISYLNLDMIGRLQENLTLHGMGSSPDWTVAIETANAALSLPLHLQDDSYLPTDATSFYLQKIPILNAFTGAHKEYHTPHDTAEKINLQGAQNIAQLMGHMTQELLERQEPLTYQEMKKPERLERRAYLRAYLGTIPDYSESDLKGVKISGVAKGGPADKASIQPGDIITQLAGKKIENIYDYTYAIEALKIGQTVSITIHRKEKILTKQITPSSRQ